MLQQSLGLLYERLDLLMDLWLLAPLLDFKFSLLLADISILEDVG